MRLRLIRGVEKARVRIKKPLLRGLKHIGAGVQKLVHVQVRIKKPLLRGLKPSRGVHSGVVGGVVRIKKPLLRGLKLVL